MALVGAVLQQVVVNVQRIRQGTPRCLTLSSYTMTANCAPGAKSAVYESASALLNRRYTNWAFGID